MSSHGGENSPIIKTATNEYVLLANRVFVSACAALLVWFATGIRTDTADLKRDFVIYQLADEARLSKIEGRVSAVEGSVEVHRRRLEGQDTDIRSIWTRIYDLAAGRSTPRPP